MFSLNLKPMLIDMVEYLIEQGSDPVDALEEAMDIMIASVREEILDD